MRVVFAGTPDFSRIALECLQGAGFTIPLVLTQPDRPAGRGMKLQASPVKRAAMGFGIHVVQPCSLRLDGKYPDDATQAAQSLAAADADVMVVAAYGLILPQWVLELPRRGCLNIHASLLPRWRGAAPIHRAIEAGDGETGVTIMQMDAGLDTGDMLLMDRVPIGATETTGSLHDRLAVRGGRLIVRALELAVQGGLVRTPQPATGVTYAHKIHKDEAQVDWSLPAPVLERRLRAFDPSPGAATVLGNESLKLWRGEVITGPGGSAPGTVLAAGPCGIDVATGDGVLRVTELQRAGGKRLPAAAVLQGWPLATGQRFGPKAA